MPELTAPCPLELSEARLQAVAAVEALGRLLTDHREVLEDYEMRNLVGLIHDANDVHVHLLRLLGGA